VGKYLVEVYVPSSSPDALTSAVARARSAAGEMALDGMQVTYLRSLFLPGDELCFLLYEGPSAEAIGEAVRRAAITFERIVEADTADGVDPDSS